MHLVEGLLQIQNQMKLYHWQTYSHARHRSIDDFLKRFVETLDTFVETYQGRHGRIRLREEGGGIRLRNMGGPDDDESAPDQFLKGAVVLLQEVLPEYVDESDVDLLNLRDEMLGHVNQLRYLFTLA